MQCAAAARLTSTSVRGKRVRVSVTPRRRRTGERRLLRVPEAERVLPALATRGGQTAEVLFVPVIESMGVFVLFCFVRRERVRSA